ncbi:hypothetical protein [Variovorax sp. YR752]|uniref:hypothetical protein n=1 Tax=Variovorax sp. YR752 TaxID=1884383 RepID=UPI003137B185
MGTTTKLRQALKTEVFPLLTDRGFAIDQRHAPHFVDFRRSRGDRVDFIEFQWEKYGRPRFKLSFGTVSAGGTVANGLHTLAQDIGPGQAPRYVCLYPRGTGSSTRHWFCQDAPLWARLFGGPPRPAGQVTAELTALLPEVDDYLLHGRLGPHCFDRPNPPFEDVP